MCPLPMTLISRDPPGRMWMSASSISETVNTKVRVTVPQVKVTVPSSALLMVKPRPSEVISAVAEPIFWVMFSRVIPSGTMLLKV